MNDPLTLTCPCCDDVVIISRQNMQSLINAATVIYGEESDVTIDISLLPPRDWTAPATPRQIAGAMAAFSLTQASDE